MNMKNIIVSIKNILSFSLIMFILCGLIYPLGMTAIAQCIFPSQANGSIIYNDKKAVGSSLIGQNFTDSKFMKARPSAVAYNTYTKDEIDSGIYKGISTGSNNYAPSNPKLAERIESDIKNFLEENPTIKKGDIPEDLLTASGSGLDPHISPSSADVQVESLVQNTGLSEHKINEIIKNNTKGKLLGVFGEETVNVLGVNLDIAKELKIIN